MSPADRHVHLLAKQFSEDSGGRTRVTLDRARLLARHGLRVHVLTTNYKLDYAYVYEAWRARLGIDRRVSFDNLFEHVAGEPLFEAGPVVAFVQEAGATYRQTRRGDGWDFTREDGTRLRHVVREDGSLSYVDLYRDGVKSRHDNYDRQGRLRRRTTLRPGTRHAESVDYLTRAGRVFLRASARSADAPDLRYTVVRSDGSEGESFDDEFALRCAWVRDLAAGRPGSPFVAEDRRMDGLLVANPWQPDLTPIAVIHSTHLAPPYEDLHHLANYNDSALRRASAFSKVVVATHQQAEDIAVHYPDIDNVVVIPHIIHFSRQHLRWRRRDERVVVLARLVELKRVDHAIRAFASVTAARPRARLEIWGTGDDEERLRALVDELGLADVVSLRGYTTDSIGVLEGARVVVSTSRVEGFGMSTMEALAAGAPVVSYDYRYGPEELIRDGRNGRIVENGDVAALGRAVTQVLTRRVRWWRWSLSARTVLLRNAPRGVLHAWQHLLADG